MKILVGDSSRGALVKLIGLAIVFKRKSMTNFCVVKSNVAAKVVRSYERDKKEQNGDSHFEGRMDGTKIYQ